MAGQFHTIRVTVKELVGLWGAVVLRALDGQSLQSMQSVVQQQASLFLLLVHQEVMVVEHVEHQLATTEVEEDAMAPACMASPTQLQRTDQDMESARTELPCPSNPLIL